MFIDADFTFRRGRQAGIDIDSFCCAVRMSGVDRGCAGRGFHTREKASETGDL